MRRWALSGGLLGLVMCGCAAAPVSPPVVAESVEAAAPAAPPEIAAVTEIEDGPGLTDEQVSRVLVNRSLAVGGCHVVEYSGRAPEPGFVVVHLAIQRDGHVKSAQVSDSSYQQGSLPQCVASVTREINFPPASGETVVSWRFDFKGK